MGAQAMTSDSQLDLETLSTICGVISEIEIQYQGKSRHETIQKVVDTLISRGILVTRDEALAAQGALIEQAEEIADSHSRKSVFDVRDCANEICDSINSLATAPMQAALERQQASVAADRQQILTILDDMIPADAPQDDRVFVAYQRIGALPVNEAALEKVKAEVRLEEAHQWLMSEGLDKQARLKWKQERIALLEKGE